MSIFHHALVLFLVTLPAAAQLPAFETVTLRPARSADPRSVRVQILPNGGLIAKAVPVITLLRYAYDVPSNPSPRLFLLPDWTIGERYDIQAKAPASTISASSSDSETQSRVKHMIRELLIDHFRLLMGVEKKRMSVYALEVSSSGPKLQKSAITTKDCVFDTAPGGCHTFIIGFGHPLNAKAISMDDLAHYIENWTDLPVVNRTALRGLFAVNTEGWLPMQLPPPPPNTTGDVNFSSLPTLATVLGKIGLYLRRQEAILPVYTVRRIERPRVN